MATMTMSKEWIYQHGIYRLLKRSESVRSTATALMAIVECTYVLKDKEYIRILKLFSVLCRNIIYCPKLGGKSITTIPMVYISIQISWRKISMQSGPIKNG